MIVAIIFSSNLWDLSFPMATTYCDTYCYSLTIHPFVMIDASLSSLLLWHWVPTFPESDDLVTARQRYPMMFCFLPSVLIRTVDHQSQVACYASNLISTRHLVYSEPIPCHIYRGIADKQTLFADFVWGVILIQYCVEKFPIPLNR